MTKENWKLHIEKEGNIIRPSHGGSKLAWSNFLHSHCQGCLDCMARKKTQLANFNAKAKHEALTSIGLVRVKGALGGTYYE
jgi:hypothetical protein